MERISRLEDRIYGEDWKPRLNPDFERRVLAKRAANKRESNDEFEKVLNRVCRAMGLHKDYVMSKDKRPELVIARRAVAYWVRRRTGYSYSKLGKITGQHGKTVMRSVNAYAKEKGLPL